MYLGSSASQLSLISLAAVFPCAQCYNGMTHWHFRRVCVFFALRHSFAPCSKHSSRPVPSGPGAPAICDLQEEKSHEVCVFSVVVLRPGGLCRKAGCRGV